MIQDLTVDWDSLDDIGKYFRKFKTRYFQLKRKQDGKPTYKERNRDIFDACTNIIQSKISEVYKDLILDKEPKYYVYSHLDPSRKIAIGKNGFTTFAATLGMTHFPFISERVKVIVVII